MAAVELGSQSMLLLEGTVTLESELANLVFKLLDLPLVLLFKCPDSRLMVSLGQAEPTGQAVLSHSLLVFKLFDFNRLLSDVALVDCDLLLGRH